MKGQVLRIIGLIIVIAVINATTLFIFFRPQPTTAINGLFGGGKISLFEDPSFPKQIQKSDALVRTTDPSASNSGDMLLRLPANSLNGGKVITAANLPTLTPQIKAIYQQIDNMPTSSEDMFSQYLRQGIGFYPLVAGYESQMSELSKMEPETYAKIQDSIQILCSSPTACFSHVYVPLRDNRVKGLEDLKRPGSQKLAWESHGFRIVVAATADPKQFAILGVPQEVTKVMPILIVDIMLQLMEIFKTYPLLHPLC